MIFNFFATPKNSSRLFFSSVLILFFFFLFKLLITGWFGLVNSSSQAEAEQFIKAWSIQQQKVYTVLYEGCCAKFDMGMYSLNFSIS